MGTCISSNPQCKVADARTLEVEAAMRSLQAEDQREHRVLVLGAGESGKSTILKQLKMIFKVGFSDHELLMFKRSLKQNVLDSAKAIFAQSQMGTYGTLSVNHSFQNAILEDQVALTLQVATSIYDSWRDDIAFKSIWENRGKFWILDAASYYFDHAKRIAQDDFEPDEDDCIMARTRTTGMVTSKFNFRQSKYTIIDVGGQRSERRKWIHFFDNVQAIVFVVSLIEYNQVMFEDQSCNRLHDSLQLFAQIVSNPIFVNTPIVLFLNKKDLFEQMIQKTDLASCFPDYTCGKNSLLASEFIKNKFCDVFHRFRQDELHCHVVAASVRMDIKIAFKDVINSATNTKH